MVSSKPQGKSSQYPFGWVGAIAVLDEVRREKS